MESVKSGWLKLDTYDMLTFLVNSWVLGDPDYRVLAEVLLTLCIMSIHKANNMLMFSKYRFMHIALNNHADITELSKIL